MVMRGWGESSPASPKDKFVVLAGWGSALPAGSPAAPRVVAGATDHGGFVARPAPSSVPGATLLAWRDAWVEPAPSAELAGRALGPPPVARPTPPLPVTSWADSVGQGQGSWRRARPTSATSWAEAAVQVQGSRPPARPTSAEWVTSAGAEAAVQVQGSRLPARPPSAECDASAPVAGYAGWRGLSGSEELSRRKRPLQPSGSVDCSPPRPDGPLLDSAWRPPGSAQFVSRPPRIVNVSYAVRPVPSVVATPVGSRAVVPVAVPSRPSASATEAAAGLRIAAQAVAAASPVLGFDDLVERAEAGVVTPQADLQKRQLVAQAARLVTVLPIGAIARAVGCSVGELAGVGATRLAHHLIPASLGAPCEATSSM